MDNYTVKEHYLNSMTPQEQVFELLDKAISDLSRAKAAFSGKQFEEANRLLIETQNIFEELGGALRDEDFASRQGKALFARLTDELFYANLNGDMDRLEQVRIITERLKITYGTQLGKLRFK